MNGTSACDKGLNGIGEHCRLYYYRTALPEMRQRVELGCGVCEGEVEG